jgi:4-hydroxy-tetrahydrodipicolinate synthase
MFAPFGHLVTAMVTPFDAEGNLALDLVEALVKRLVRTGTETILLGGTTGESPTLEDSELLELIDKVREFIPEKIKIIVGTGTNSTAKSIKLSQKVIKKNVDGLLLVNPYYNKPMQDGLYAHFKAIAESVKIPVVLYNIPGRTGVNCEPETIAKLAEIDNIVAVKEASGNVAAVAKIRGLTKKDKFAIYSGDDVLTLPMLSVGAVGVVSVASHIVGAKISDMIKNFFDGDVEKAMDIHVSLVPLFDALFCETNPIPVKYALNRIGCPVGGHRLPMTPIRDKSREIVDANLKKVGLIH